MCASYVNEVSFEGFFEQILKQFGVVEKKLLFARKYGSD